MRGVEHNGIRYGAMVENYKDLIVAHADLYTFKTFIAGNVRKRYKVAWPTFYVFELKSPELLFDRRRDVCCDGKYISGNVLGVNC